MCGGEGAASKERSRRQDKRWPLSAWNPGKRAALWQAIQTTVRKHGIGWSVWVCISTAPRQPLPPKLQLESVPISEVEALAGGGFKWGRYKTSSEVTSRDDAWVELNDRWVADRVVRIRLLREQDEQAGGQNQAPRGEAYTLKHKSCLKQYQGQLWSTPEEWHFQEDGTGLVAKVPVKDEWPQTKDFFARRDRQLLAEMNAEYARQRCKQKAQVRAKSRLGDRPQTPGDMAIQGTSKEGKKIYSWGDTEGGRVQVQVTPRLLRAPLEADASKHRAAMARETTPVRALRKMLAKLGRMKQRAARGNLERIVARQHLPDATASMQTFSEQDHPALQKLKSSLNNSHKLEAATAAMKFLQSIRLHHCSNCDEEWPVFDAPWPQTGVPWTGAKAGECETIERAGFKASIKKESLCSRCETSSVYRKMYSKDNLQHLGPRYEELSKLTWYESLLVARVHPMMSVITLTATGLLCYAGHVCNYYVKTLEWFRGLPAVLRDKRWFLIKRRRSTRSSSSEFHQKKPTTANRGRLQAAIQVLMKVIFPVGRLRAVPWAMNMFHAGNHGLSTHKSIQFILRLFQNDLCSLLTTYSDQNQNLKN